MVQIVCMWNNFHMKKIILCIIIISAGVLLVFGLYEKNKVTTLGVIAPLTGIVASYGEDIQKGVLAAGIKPTSIVFEDDRCEPSAAVSAFNKLVNVDKVSVIIGPGCGSPQEAIVPLLKDKNVIMIVPSAASKELFDGSNGKFFNIQYSLEDEAAFLAQKIFERNQKKVVLITYQNAFSKTVADSFKSTFQGEIVKEISFVDGKSDILTEIAKLKGLEFDAILSTDITFFFVQGMEKLKQYGITAPVYSEYTVELPAVRTLVEGVYYSFPGGIEGEGGATVELSKEAGEIAKDATEKCSNDTKCIKRYLQDSGLFDSEGTSKREIILKQIKEGRAKEIK